MTNKTVVKMLFGSHMYGTATENSDKDYKSIVMPDVKQILEQEANFSITETTGQANSKNGVDDVDNETFSFMRFLKLAAKGETVAIDMLHAPQDAILEHNDMWQRLVENRDMFYTKNMKAYIGYVRKQAAKYGVKGSRLAALEDAINVAKEYADTYYTVEGLLPLLPINEFAQIVTIENEKTGLQTFYEVCGRKFQTSNSVDYFIERMEDIYAGYGARAKAAKENDGIDWKALHHALRAGYQAKYIYTDGTFSYPLPETDFLMQVKRGELDYLTEVQPVLEDLVDEVMILAEESFYPEKVNMKDIHRIIFREHLNIVEEYLNE